MFWKNERRTNQGNAWPVLNSKISKTFASSERSLASSSKRYDGRATQHYLSDLRTVALVRDASPAPVPRQPLRSPARIARITLDTPDRLQFVAFLRFFSVILGYCYPDTLSENVFAAALDQATPLQSRTFAIWTTTSCMLCLLCARNIGNRQLYAATFGSFVIALGYFLIEHVVYGTVPLKRAMQPLVVASVSILWMGAGFNYYTDYVHSMPAFSEEVTAGGDNKTD
jgi:hypothetical protein